MIHPSYRSVRCCIARECEPHACAFRGSRSGSANVASGFGFGQTNSACRIDNVELRLNRRLCYVLLLKNCFYLAAKQAALFFDSVKITANNPAASAPDVSSSAFGHLMKRKSPVCALIRQISVNRCKSSQRFCDKTPFDYLRLSASTRLEEVGPWAARFMALI